MKDTVPAFDLNKKDDWATPVAAFETACKWAGFVPSLDVCALPGSAKCARYFTPADDGLKRAWDEDFWMNPPYSAVAKWVRRAADQAAAHGVRGIGLVFSKTDTAWFHDIVARRRLPVAFFRGRICFLDGGRKRLNAPFPSMAVRFGPPAATGQGMPRGARMLETWRAEAPHNNLVRL